MSNTELGASATEALLPCFFFLLVCLFRSITVCASRVLGKRFLVCCFFFLSYVVLPLLILQQQDTERFGSCAGKRGGKSGICRSGMCETTTSNSFGSLFETPKNSQSLVCPKQNYLCFMQNVHYSGSCHQ